MRVGKTLRQLRVEPSPVDPVRQDDKLVLHVDDLIETGAEKVAVPRFLLLSRSHPIPKINASRESQMGRKRTPKSPENRAGNPAFLQIPLLQITGNALQIKGVLVFHGETK